jgi:hypothetical protein
MFPEKTAPEILASFALLIHTAPPFGLLPITELLTNLVLDFTRSDDSSFIEIAPP